MDPITLAIAGSFVIGVGNSLLQSNSAISQLKYQAKQKNKEAEILYFNAANQSLANSINEDLMREETAKNISDMRVSIAESGITGGTLIEYQQQAEKNAEADILMQRFNMSSAYHAQLYEAQKAKQEANEIMANAKRVKKTRWLNSLVSGASSAFDTASSGGAFK